MLFPVLHFRRKPEHEMGCQVKAGAEYSRCLVDDILAAVLSQETLGPGAVGVIQYIQPLVKLLRGLVGNDRVMYQSITYGKFFLTLNRQDTRSHNSDEAAMICNDFQSEEINPLIQLNDNPLYVK